MNLCNIDEIKGLLARHGFHFSKSMGQNFLIQDWVPRDIAAASGAGPGVGVLEIGPGIGPLTRELSLLAQQVTAVELDESLLPILDETLADRDNVTVIPGDIMRFDLDRVVDGEFPGLIPIVCANLPYNITTPVITRLLECRRFASVTVMIQKEVAKRICAQPGTSDYGAFSVLCQYYANTEYLFDVPASCFLPAPKVTSAVVRMTAQQPPAEVEDEAMFFKVVRGAFAQRRKTLLNSLSSSFSATHNKEQLTAAILSCGLSADVRGERLGIPEFAALARALAQKD